MADTILYSDYLTARNSVNSLLSKIGIAPLKTEVLTSDGTTTEVPLYAQQNQQIFAEAINEMVEAVEERAKYAVIESLSDVCQANYSSHYQTRYEANLQTHNGGYNKTYYNGHYSGRQGSYNGTHWKSWRGGNRSHNGTHYSGKNLRLGT